MVEKILQKASLVGQVVEDLSFQELLPGRYFAELVGVERNPYYKEGGFFVFSDLKDDDYKLRISGHRFQMQTFQVSTPLSPSGPPTLLSPIFFHQEGDNELAVVVTSTENGGTVINFDPVVLTKDIRAGSPVLGTGFSAQLAEKLETGSAPLGRVKLENLSTSPAAGAILRIIRDNSVRILFDPYYRFLSPVTRIVGKVVVDGAPEISLEGVQVHITQVNSTIVDINDIEGAKIVTVEISGSKTIFGTKNDITTFTNSKGDYNLYFDRADFLTGMTLEASLAGYQLQTKSVAIKKNERKIMDFQLTPQ